MNLLFKFFLLIILFSYSSIGETKNLTEKDVYKICKNKNFSNCNLIIALAKIESNFNAQSFNPEKTGSFGLLQIQCGTAKWMGHNNCKKLYDPSYNIQVGIKYLNYLENSFNPENIKTLIAAWNAGKPIVCKYNNPGFCKPGEFYNQAYVEKVYEVYKASITKSVYAKMANLAKEK